MSPDQFIRRRGDDWRTLEVLLGRAQGGRVAGLSEVELRTLGALYRAGAADLALAQRDFPHHDVTAFLNTLVGRAHHLVYQGESAERGSVREWLQAGFPRLVRRNGRYVGAAALLLFVPAFLCWWLVWQNPELAYRLLPEATDLLTLVEQDHRLWIDIGPEESSVAGAGIMTNNIQVTFLAFAGGILAGLLTIYILLSNGLLLGTIFGFVQAHGLAPDLAEFISGHGPVELSVICIAGGAGLRLGHSMIAPGLLRRRDAIALAAREALGLVAGGALLLVLAGTIEGFLSPSAAPWPIKALVGLVTGAAMWLWIARGGVQSVERRAQSERSTA